MFGKRILVLIPHPDDEVVACCAAIGRAQAEGSHIFALYLSHGCIARETLWPWQRGGYAAIVARRRREADDVARFLNISPVGWSDRPARHVWTQLPMVYAEITEAVKAHAIDQLWVPAYEGGNPDHDALNAVGSLFRASLSVLEFAEYNFFQNKANAQSFPFLNGHETILTLSPEEQTRKRAALKLYQSEQGNLNYVKVERECFRPLADTDYSRPPHPGTLWYARFQWVPFRHPRVDFTRSSEVSTAIAAFLRRD